MRWPTERRRRTGCSVAPESAVSPLGISTAGARRSCSGRIAALLGLLVAAACGGDSASPPPPPPRVIVTPGSVEAHTSGQTFQFSARVVGSDGNPVTGATVAWASSAEAVATVSQTGLATVVGQGRATISARVESASGSATVVADLKPAELIKVAGDRQTAPALTQLPIAPTVRVVDAAGLPLSGRLVEFELFDNHERASVSPRSARTNDAGEASTQWTLGLGPNAWQDMRVYADTFYVDFRATATAPPLTVWTTSLPRARATVPYESSLEAVGGVPPYAWSAGPGDLPAGLVLDSAGVLSGAAGAEGVAEIGVSVMDAAGTVATGQLRLRSCPAPVVLEVGEVRTFEPLAFGSCPPFIPAGTSGDRYHVAMVHTAAEPALRPARAELKVVEPWPGRSGSSEEAAPHDHASFSGAGPGPSGDDDVLEWGPDPGKRARMKARVLDAAESLARNLAPEALLPDLAPGARAQRRAAAETPPPERRLVVPTRWEGDPCEALAPVPARLVAYDDFMAVYQDSAQRAVAPVDSAAAAAALEYYAAHGAPTIEEYFGGVSDINGDGRIVVFVTPVVPSDLWAYVWGADFWDQERCAGSNQMEVIYFSLTPFRLWADEQPGRFSLLPLVVHEVKHVSSLYRRSRTRNWHPRWVEEGTAEIAAEVSSRRAIEAAGGVRRYDVFTRSAYPPRSGSVVTPENVGSLNRLARIAFAYSEPANSVVLSPSADNGGHYYGTSWHFHRFLADAYGGAEAGADSAFFRQLNEASTSPGIAGITQATGQPAAKLLEEYATAMALAGTGAPRPERAFRTYDFRSALTDLFLPTAPDRVRRSYPWPVTGPGPAAFEDAVYSGYLYPAGIRFHEFESDGAGEGIELEATANGALVRMIVARIR